MVWVGSCSAHVFDSCLKQIAFRDALYSFVLEWAIVSWDHYYHCAVLFIILSILAYLAACRLESLA